MGVFTFLAIPIGTVWGDCVTPDGVATLSCIPILFTNIVSGALAMSGIFALFLVTWAGLKYINSRGDAKKAEEAKKTLSYAFLGLVLIFFSFFLVYFIATVTGADCIRFFGTQGFGSCK